MGSKGNGGRGGSPPANWSLVVRAAALGVSACGALETQPTNNNPVQSMADGGPSPMVTDGGCTGVQDSGAIDAGSQDAGAVYCGIPDGGGADGRHTHTHFISYDGAVPSVMCVEAFPNDTLVFTSNVAFDEFASGSPDGGLGYGGNGPPMEVGGVFFLLDVFEGSVARYQIPACVHSGTVFRWFSTAHPAESGGTVFVK